MSERRRAFLALLVVAVCFGGTWPAGKLAGAHVAPATVATIRFVVASALLWLLARASGRPVRRPALADLPLVLALGLTAPLGYNLFFLYGVRLAPATDGSILVPGVIPVLTTALAWPLYGDRPSARAGAGLALALVGLVLVVDPAGAIGTHRLEGDALLVGAAACWAAYTLLGAVATRRYDSVRANVYTTTAGALALLPLSFLVGGWSGLATARPSAWASIAYLGVVGTVLPFVLFYEGVRLIGSAKASAFTLLVPVFGVLASMLVLGERLRPLAAAGGAIVLVGLWIVQRPSSAAAPVGELAGS